MSLLAMSSQADAAHADKEVIVRNNPSNIPVFALRALLTQQLQLTQHTSLSCPELKQLRNRMKDIVPIQPSKQIFHSNFAPLNPLKFPP